MNKQTILDRLNIKNFYSTELPTVKWNDAGKGQALCPLHDDKKPSLSVDSVRGYFKCFGCGKSGSVFDFYMAKKGVDYQTAVNDLAILAGLNPESQRKIVKTYDYTDESGKTLYQTVRYEPKDFYQRRPDGKGGWTWNLQEVRLVPYNLPEVIKIKTDNVFIVEGEKDVENLRTLGFTATCNPLGAGKWKSEYNEHFNGKRVVILPDNDEPGQKHSLQVAKNLKDIAESVKVIKLPGLPEKGDVTDWIEAGGTQEKLIEMIAGAAEWIPESPLQLNDPLYTREAGKLKLSSLQDIFNYEEPAYLIDSVLIENTLTLLTAYAGIGKSLLSLHIAYAVLTGRSLFDYFNVSNQSRVLIVDEENPGSFLKERLTRIGFTNDLPVSFLHFQKVKLDNHNCFMELVQLIKDIKPTLVIFDALIRLHNKKENDAEMSLVMERLRDIVNLGITVLVIHHHRKGAGNNKEAVRGSSDILGGVDMSLSLEEKDDYLILSSPKTRSQPIEPIRLKLETLNDALTFRYAGDELNDNQIAVNEITAILHEKGVLSVNEIFDELKTRGHEVGKNKLRDILQKATGKELAEARVDRGKKLYSLNPTFTASQGIYIPANCEFGNDPVNNLHSLTKDTPVNCETEKQEVTDLSGDDVEIIE